MSRHSSGGLVWLRLLSVTPELRGLVWLTLMSVTPELKGSGVVKAAVCHARALGSGVVDSAAVCHARALGSGVVDSAAVCHARAPGSGVVKAAVCHVRALVWLGLLSITPELWELVWWITLLSVSNNQNVSSPLAKKSCGAFSASDPRARFSGHASGGPFHWWSLAIYVHKNWPKYPVFHSAMRDVFASLAYSSHNDSCVRQFSLAYTMIAVLVAWLTQCKSAILNLIKLQPSMKSHILL